MAPRRVKINKFDSKKLSANDVICPICRSILIRPITLPCSHGFCSSCFDTTTENSNVVCPLCRVRVGSWLRSATKSKKIVNETFWQAIQDSFPLQVKNKLKGLSGKVLEGKSEKRSVGNNKIGEKVSKAVKAQAIINKFCTSKKPDVKEVGKLVSVPSTSTTAGRKNNQTVPVKAEKNERATFFLNNFATKEYTCRILCQNVSSKDKNESQNLSLKKNKRIQKITESELSNDRSNSIESECLYFKPIDYRHNPPSEGLAPIKVPTRKPNINANAKILAPCGQNQININSLESAFARLFSPILPEVEVCKKENIQSQMSSQLDASLPAKRKHEKTENKTKKKVKAVQKPTENQSFESKESVTIDLTKTCDDFDFSLSNCMKKINLKSAKNVMPEESLKRLQEQADFELATKLQQTYNQAFQYSTRSAVLKRTNQVKMGGMTPYKVK
ncbi:uncharacterized protein LOC103314904 [Tribolium castaneum]|uniref:RING-type E3 ubiquitin transferase n=1 Tax=Tribolium castaneum TaxID=7070 RepID=D7EK05_TRICA|nr:PREDICTED: uncharacterized protein LOC103314904 [Tribolium castaneum]EFA12951.1 hypothetical protein TcasGA2_TC005071 [Tribolium castaneum]|eukprot:XP_008200386.1 PREDICTED: uncharacterized protein LOC103314904 [Tribolium castaneum]